MNDGTVKSGDSGSEDDEDDEDDKDDGEKRMSVSMLLKYRGYRMAAFNGGLNMRAHKLLAADDCMRLSAEADRDPETEEGVGGDDVDGVDIDELWMWAMGNSDMDTSDVGNDAVGKGVVGNEKACFAFSPPSSDGSIGFDFGSTSHGSGGSDGSGGSATGGSGGSGSATAAASTAAASTAAASTAASTAAAPTAASAAASTAAASTAASTNGHSSAPVRTWSKEMVVEWLGSIGGAYVQYGAAFLFEGVDGEELLEISADDLVEFGVNIQRHQRRILKEVTRLRAS
jgi:hypothetical protein